MSDLGAACEAAGSKEVFHFGKFPLLDKVYISFSQFFNSTPGCPWLSGGFSTSLKGSLPLISSCHRLGTTWTRLKKSVFQDFVKTIVDRWNLCEALSNFLIWEALQWIFASTVSWSLAPST